jgi:hypothetical protein
MSCGKLIASCLEEESQQKNVIPKACLRATEGRVQQMELWLKQLGKILKKMILEKPGCIGSTRINTGSQNSPGLDGSTSIPGHSPNLWGVSEV